MANQKVLGSVFAILASVFLIFSSVASAISLNVSNVSASEIDVSENVSFQIDVSVLSSERIDLANVTVNVGAEACTFNMNGTTLSACSNFVITPLNNASNFYGYGYGYGYGYSDGDLKYNVTWTATAEGDYNISFSAIQTSGAALPPSNVESIIVTEAGVQIASDVITTVEDDTDSLEFTLGSQNVSRIIIPSSIPSDKEITLDMSALLPAPITMAKDLTLVRETSQFNYTVKLFANTNISNSSAWDGTLTMPTVTSTTTSLGTVETVIEVGSDAGLTFDKAVRVTLEGMSGKDAFWADGSGTHAIIDCDDSTASTLTSGECVWDDGTDLNIWTFHFTDFGAYTAPSSRSSSGSRSVNVTKIEVGPVNYSDNEVARSVASEAAPEASNASPEFTATTNEAATAPGLGGLVTGNVPVIGGALVGLLAIGGILFFVFRKRK